jgi:predicted permease
MRQALEGWTRDLVLAARNLVRAPGFTSVTVLTLALAIGANTAIFSVVDAVLLDPLAFPEADRLVSIRGTAPGSDLPEEFGVGTEFYVQYRENATTLADLALYQEVQTTVRAGDQVERLFVAPVSPSLYSVLGVQPVLGRLPTEADEEGMVLLIGHRLWTEWFGADPSVLDRPIEVAGGLRTIIGVLGPDFAFPQERTDVWVHDLPTEPITPGGFGLGLVGRLAPGVTHETLTAELATLARRLPERFGGSARYQGIIEQHRPVVRSLEEELVGDFEGPLWILMGTVGIVLLIACANVANLLIVRADSRRLDLAVRRALGAGRAGLIRSQMAETFVLAAVGGGGGVLLAWVGVPVLVRSAPENIPGLSSVGIDPSALFFTAAVATLAALGAGLLPAVRFSNPETMGALGTSRRAAGGRDHLVRDGLVVVQTAAALVLLVGSALLVQSFLTLRSVDPGYDVDDIFTFQMAPDTDEHGLSDGPTFAQFHYDFMDRVAALQGVESVGLVNTLPLDEGAGTARFETQGIDATGEVEVPLRLTLADGDYFRTMGIELLSGSLFERNANPGDQVRVIVSRSAAQRLWPGEEPLGQLLRPAGAPAQIGWLMVGGVVEDVMLTDFRQEEPDPIVYLPVVGQTAGSWAVGTPAYVVKTARTGSIASEIRDLVAEVAPSAPMYRVFTMEQLADRSMAQLTFTMLTLGVAAALALILGAIGLYGTLSYVVSQRTREIGIRMALGARAAQVRRMVVTQGGVVVLVGVVIGVAGALGLTRVLESLLFGIAAVDVRTLIVTAALMVVVSLLAAYNPARRASSVDPMQSLRVE